LIEDPQLWDDPERARRLLKAKDRHEKSIRNYSDLAGKADELNDLFALASDEEETEVLAEIAKELAVAVKNADQLELDTLFSGEEDSLNAIVTIHPGAGGTESQDWAEMLMRMYLRWAEQNDYKTTILDYQEGEGAGIKSATLTITGENAFGRLKAEAGVHRLVRISPFDSGARRHTSFSSVHVLPEIESDIEIEINPSDLRIDTYRASGAGGQHVNKTDSAVRITHLPTNTVVQCQNERSQHQNRENAMKILKAKLYQLKQEEEAAELASKAADKKEIGWGSQIRSYVFHPYNMVKDHRTNVETSNVQAVMDGAIDDFIHAYLVSLTQSK
jgi:peptide chain release factor 2